MEILNQVPVIHILSDILGERIRPLLKTCKRGQEYNRDYYVLTNIYKDPWHVACVRGDLGWVKHLHETSYEPKHPYLMNYACEFDHFEVVKYLHSIGEPCDGKSVDFAYRNGNIEMVKFLATMCSADIFNAMCTASINGDLEMVKYFHSLPSCYKNTKVMSLQWSARRGHVEIFKFIHSEGTECTPAALAWAISNRRTEIIEYIMTHEKRSFVEISCGFNILRMQQ